MPGESSSRTENVPDPAARWYQVRETEREQVATALERLEATDAELTPAQRAAVATLARRLTEGLAPAALETMAAAAADPERGTNAWPVGDSPIRGNDETEPGEPRDDTAATTGNDTGSEPTAESPLQASSR
ncbi:hypothetical protein [Halopiger goleimassiliensis]|uniref:hypothetical protein n=1 Tax=Halopiger goleimassiliensis TaxID=1293048 RepID=UPI000677B559|nr:hypothetical protein [Halopiger goleimassiliensis]